MNAFEKQEISRVEIPKSEGVESWTVTKRGGIYYKFEEEMEAFGKEHGFPVLFVFYDYKSEYKDGVFKTTSAVKLFLKGEVHDAAAFAKEHGTELGIYDPKEKYEQEVLQFLRCDFFKRNLFVMPVQGRSRNVLRLRRRMGLRQVREVYNGTEIGD
ncbi:MAG: hypothetical protein J6U20_03880 [Fibrobacter sp.]|nr:hypothetical protein [Fibrobacter sp.]